MSKQPKPDGNFLTDILMPFLVAGMFLAGLVYSVLKFTKLL